MKLIESKTLGTAAASIEFTSIPQTFTDLFIVCSLRSSDSGSYVNINLGFNANTSNFSARWLYGLGSGGTGTANSIVRYAGEVNTANDTANTFNNSSIYIPNYTGSTHKSFSTDSVRETNASTNAMAISAGLWSDTSAITSVQLDSSAGNYVAGSTISLYGILKGSDGIVTTS
jgi:hypothetical protein